MPLQRWFKALQTFFATSFSEWEVLPDPKAVPISAVPSWVPTEQPTWLPSLEPTIEPTPTPEPTTLAPTPEPTFSPTPDPTLPPTPSPTPAPITWPWFNSVMTFFSNSFVQFAKPEEPEPDIIASLLYVPTKSPTPYPTPVPTPSPTPHPTTLSPTAYARAPGTKFSKVQFGYTLGVTGPLDPSLYGAFLYGLEGYNRANCVDYCQRKETSLDVEFTGYVVYEGRGTWSCGCLLHPVCAIDPTPESDTTPGVIYSSQRIEPDPSCPAFSEYLPESGYTRKGLPPDDAVAMSTLAEGVLTCQLFCDMGSFPSAIYYPDMMGVPTEDNCYCLDDGQLRDSTMCVLGRGLPVGMIYSQAGKSFCRREGQ